MNIKRNPIGSLPAGLKTMVKFTGLTWLGLVLVAFGLPVSGGWLAAAMPRGAKNRSGIWD